MSYRMFKGVAFAGALLALNGFASECKGVALYSDGSDNGQMIESGRTFQSHQNGCRTGETLTEWVLLIFGCLA